MSAEAWLNTAEAKANAATAPIDDAPGYYVREDGTVWSSRNWRGYGDRQIVPLEGTGGYLKVRLSLPSGKRINRNVHRLMAEAFLPPRPDGHQIRHLNGDKTDNRLANLAWGTPLDNAADRDRHGTTARGERNGFARIDATTVLEVRRLRRQGLMYREIEKLTGVERRHVGKIIRKEAWTHVD